MQNLNDTKYYTLENSPAMQKIRSDFEKLPQ